MATAEQSSEQRPWLRHYPARIAHYLTYTDVPLYQFLADSAHAHPERTALLFFGRKTSYRALLDEAKQVAAGLVKLGLRKGDRVAIMLPNCPQLVAAYYGALWAGGVVVMVNPLYTPHELQFQLKDCGARFLVALDQFYPKVEQSLEGTSVERVAVTGIQERLPFPLNVLYPLKLRREGHTLKVPKNERTLRFRDLLTYGVMEQPALVEPQKDLALIQYTGGTTGTPKGVVLTHANLVANCVQLQAWLPPINVEQLAVVGALPFFHVYGMTTVMNWGLMNGARIILFPRFELVRVLKAIQKYRPQLFPGVPAMYVAINNYPEVGRFDLKSIVWCISGAAALPQEVKETFERLTGGRLVEGFGLSEASPVTHCNPLDGVQKPGSIGMPLPDTEAIIADLESGRPLPPDTPGELLIRGRQVMQGYWNRPEETAAALKDGWLHTGDVARMDEDGHFFILDRLKEMINAAGFKVFPREVEEALYQHPAIREAAVIGVPDPYRGETVKAFVVLKADARCTADELEAWCRERLAGYKVPRQVEFVQELPKSLIGKVVRRVLAEQERSRLASAAAQEAPGLETAPKTTTE